MLTWLDSRMITAFPVNFLLFLVLPFIFPALTIDLLGEVRYIPELAYPRQWVLNTVVLPILPTDAANSLVAWWMQTDYWGELGLQLLLSINAFIPFAIIQFWIMDAVMRLRNWYYVKRFEVERQTSKTA
jgi:hypothetical protein